MTITCGLNFIKNGGISIFHGGEGGGVRQGNILPSLCAPDPEITPASFIPKPGWFFWHINRPNPPSRWCSKAGQTNQPMGIWPLLGGLTIIERSWNSGDLPYLVANTNGLNFIKIVSIWTFHGGQGGPSATLCTWMWLDPEITSVRFNLGPGRFFCHANHPDSPSCWCVKAGQTNQPTNQQQCRIWTYR